MQVNSEPIALAVCLVIATPAEYVLHKLILMSTVPCIASMHNLTCCMKGRQLEYTGC